MRSRRLSGQAPGRHQGTFQPGADGWHQWKAGVTANPLAPWGEDKVCIDLCWKNDADFDVVVEDAETGREVASARALPNDSRAEPITRAAA